MPPKSTSEEMELLKRRNEELSREIERRAVDLEAAHRRLHSLEEKYLLSFAQVQDVIYIIDGNLTINSISPSVEKILGYRPEDFIGRPVTDLRHIFTPESFSQVLDDAFKMLRKEKFPQRVYEFITRDGAVKYGEVSGSPIERQGRIVGMISIARDITSRREAENKLHHMLSFMKTLLDTIPSPIFYKDVRGIYRECNREFEAYVGIKREEIIGRDAYMLFPRELADKYHAKDQELFARPGRQVYEHPIRYADGEIRDVVVNKATVMDADGILGGVVGVMVDI